MDTYQKTWQDRSLSSDLQETARMNEEIGFHSEPEDFGSTSLSDQVAGDEMNYIYEPLNTLLNEHLTIGAYGQAVTHIGFIFVVFEDNHQRGEREETFYDPVNCSLDFQLLLNAQLISESSQPEVQNIVAQAILDYLEKLEPTDIVHIDTDEPLPDLDFHLEQFRSDLKDVFVAAKWLPEKDVSTKEEEEL